MYIVFTVMCVNVSQLIHYICTIHYTSTRLTMKDKVCSQSM